ncbi:MAG: TIGR03960 family B12-binding radical SAM protein [Thermoguttaceae bacterium]
MLNHWLKQLVLTRLLPRVQTPGQYIGGELNAVVKDHRRVRGKLCLAFPDTYAIGMSHHGLQVLYHLMNRREDWACERAFAPWTDMEALLREHRIPLYSLETFTPLGQFDVLGFSLQHELSYANVLTMLDLAGIPLRAADRTLDHPLVIAGGPCAHNPEPMSQFIDLFVIGDGEESLPTVCDGWLRLRGSGGTRAEILQAMAAALPWVYVPQCYEPGDGGQAGAVRPKYPNLPQAVWPALVKHLDAIPLPTSPVVPYVACVQDRITIEIMRGCPWHCRFCQSRAIKWPVRFRRVETILQAAWESYRNTGFEEISLLALSTSDYPYFDELMRQMQATFRPLGVGISVPSLRINEQLRGISDLLNTDRHAGLTLAPEAARDPMRHQIGKPLRNDDLYEGCREAFQRGFHRVKLYFMCGLPHEEPADLDAIMDMAEALARLGKQIRGRPVTVVVNVSNFVPKPHTPFQRHAMQRREYFQEAHRYLRRRRRLRGVELKCHPTEASLLEGVLARADRRVGQAIEQAWRQGARFDSWSDQLRPELWWSALHQCGIDVERTLHQPVAPGARLPWDHVASHAPKDKPAGPKPTDDP